MKKFILVVILGLGGFSARAISPGHITPQEADEIYKLAAQLHLMSNNPAWQAAVGQKMLEEANVFADRLRLPTPRPIRLADLKLFYCSPPFFSRYANMSAADYLAAAKSGFRSIKFGPGGYISTTNFTFYFGQCRLGRVENRVNHDERFSMYDTWAKTPSLIDTNGAYQLATQWLAAVDVDVPALNRKYPHEIVQHFFWNKPGKDYMHPPPDIPANKTLLPIFTVKWGPIKPREKYSGYAAEVEILGTTKELMELRLGMEGLGQGPDFSRRPLLVITNALELCNPTNIPLKHLEFPPPWPTNSPASTNGPAAKPPPVQRAIKTP